VQTKGEDEVEGDNVTLAQSRDKPNVAMDIGESKGRTRPAEIPINSLYFHPPKKA